MDPEDKQRLERARKWLYDYGKFAEGLPELLLAFENYLLKCEAERQAHG